jgi:hypothetical protein
MKPLGARVPLALAIVIGIGVVLRVILSLAVQPAMMNNVDSPVYTSMADGGLFQDPVRPAGYAMVLRILHVFATNLEFTIAVQHLAGILTGLLIYATVRRIGAPVWVGVAAAAAVLLSLDQVYLEHSILAETTFALLLTSALYACVRSLDEPTRLIGFVTTRHAWIVGAGVSLGFASWVRAAGAPLAPFLALWLLLAIPGRWSQRLGRAALGGATVAAIVLLYFALNDATTGNFGLTKASGRVLYGRVAPFAKCDEFTPPPGTRVLCEETPTIDRFGSDYYIWDKSSPAWKEFGPPPESDDVLGEFGREAVLGQPFSYFLAILTDTTRHFSSSLNYERASAGTPYEWMDIARRDVEEEAINERIAEYYPGESLQYDDSARTIGDLQTFLRVHPTLMLQCVILAAFGIWLSGGRVRAGIVLLLGVSLLLLVIPSVTATYNARYAIPIGGPIVAAGALGLWIVVRRLTESRAQPAETPAPS